MTVFDYEMLTKLAASLYDHGDSITNVAAHQMEIDIRLAARGCCQGARFGTESLFHHRRGTAISFVAGLLNCSAPFAMALLS